MPSSTPEFAREYKILLTFLLACLSVRQFNIHVLCPFSLYILSCELTGKLLEIKACSGTYKYNTKYKEQDPIQRRMLGFLCFVLSRYASTDDMGSQAYYVKVLIVYRPGTETTHTVRDSEGIFMLYLYFSYKLLRLACIFQCTKVLNNVITTIR